MKTPTHSKRLATVAIVCALGLASCSGGGGAPAAPVVSLSAVDGVTVYRLVSSTDAGPTLNGCPTRGNGARSAAVPSFPIFLVISADAPEQQSIATLQLELENADVLDAGDGDVTELSETSTVVTWDFAEGSPTETRRRSVRLQQKNSEDIDFIPGDVAVRIHGSAVTSAGGAAAAPETGETVWVSTIADLCV